MSRAGRVVASRHELKARRDALARFERFLPTLRLRRKQLQAELRRLALRLRERQRERDALRQSLDAWAALLGEGLELSRYLACRLRPAGMGNIAGVAVPLFEGLEFEQRWPDPFATPPWLDLAVAELRRLLVLRAECEALRRQRDLLAEELRRAFQRVNLFEKVKIPETVQAIQRIRVALGDLETAAVVRAKVAKARQTETRGGHA